jgi:hypothetical protein
MALWSPGIESTNPLACAHPERFVLKRLDEEAFLGIDQDDQSLLEVSLIEQAHHFRTHESAVRAAGELNRMGRGPVDVRKVERP